MSRTIRREKAGSDWLTKNVGNLANGHCFVFVRSRKARFPTSAVFDVEYSSGFAKYSFASDNTLQTDFHESHHRYSERRNSSRGSKSVVRCIDGWYYLD